MNSRSVITALVLTFVLAPPSCIKLDSFFFDSDKADLDDYDFNSADLDGIDPDRITSVLIPSANPNTDLHVIYVERDVGKLDPRLDPDDGITVVFSHGNRGNMLLYWYRAGYFEDMGFNVLFYDYRGYGASGGTTTEEHVYQDADTAYDYASSRDGVGTIISVGYSMGGAPAIWLCSPSSDRKPAACFTESAFTGTEAIANAASGFDVPGSWLVDASFNNKARIGSVQVPFLLMHGTEDERVAYENGEILWNKVKDNNPLNIFYPVEGAGHRNVPVPSYKGSEEPSEFSHPDELPGYLTADFEQYKQRIVDFVVSTMEMNQ